MRLSTKRYKKKIIFSLLLSLFTAYCAFSQTKQYELNDPRNPDCPCHKAQKQAEQEYAQLNAPKNKVVADPVNPPLRNINAPEKNIAAAPVTHAAQLVSSKNKHKNKTGWIKKSAFRYFRKHRGIKKMHTDYAVCFHNW